MTILAEIFCHALITVVAVVSLVLRLEHRLTKIETDIVWMKQRIDRLNSACDETEQP